MSIKILIADDHKIIRDGLRALLEKDPHMSLVGEAGDGRTAVRLAQELKPQIVIMDVSMPDLNGIEATRFISENNRGIKIIALSMHSDRRFVSAVLKAGASGYLLKDCAFEDLLVAIRTVMANRTYLSSQVADVVLKDYVRLVAKSDLSAFSILTKREREVLQCIAEGKTTKEIAALLKISVKTVETHRQRIMEKLNVGSIAELTKYAIREGLTSLEP
jgi:DNA-binding NarL/FixJ family response regulator